MSEEQARLDLAGDVTDDEPVDDASDDRLERWKERLLAAAHSEHPESGIQRRVAWLMNRYPHTRDSDIALLLAYWEHFDNLTSSTIDVSKLYDLTRLTSVDRARRSIQNSLGLFQASEDVKRMRDSLGDEHRVRDRRPDFPRLTVYADEAASSRRGGRLIVAGVWVYDEDFRLLRLIREWRQRNNIDHEFHFTDATKHRLSNYLNFIDLIANNSEFLGFTAVSVEEPASASRLEAFEKLYGLFFRNGLERSVSSGRTSLPRLLNVFKDLDDLGRDKLLLANVKNSLRADSSLLYDGQLYCDDFVPIGSHALALLQVADLYAASLNRRLNEERYGNHKDTIADHFLSTMRYSSRAGDADVTLHEAL